MVADNPWTRKTDKKQTTQRIGSTVGKKKAARRDDNIIEPRLKKWLMTEIVGMNEKKQ